MVRISDFLKRVEGPRDPHAHEPEDCGEVVREDDVREPSAVDEARGLEERFVLLGEFVGMVLEFGDVFPCFALVDLEELLCDVLKIKN